MDFVERENGRDTAAVRIQCAARVMAARALCRDLLRCRATRALRENDPLGMDHAARAIQLQFRAHVTARSVAVNAKARAMMQFVPLGYPQPVYKAFQVAAVVRIQTAWRGYVGRSYVRRVRKEREARRRTQRLIDKILYE